MTINLNGFPLVNLEMSDRELNDRKMLMDNWVACRDCGEKPEDLFWDVKCENCTEVISEFSGE